MEVQYHVRGKARAAREAVSADLEENLHWLKDYLGYKETFDLIVREFRLGARRAALVYLDSFVDQTVLTLVLEQLFRAPDRALDPPSLRELLSERVPYIEVTPEDELKTTADQILAGPVALLVDGVRHAIVLDVRQYPDRNPSEPSIERVLRGPHDGFVETLIFNTVLIRRRLRDPNLRIEMFEVGRRSKSDLALIYLKDVANPFFVREVRRRIEAIDVDALTMSEKALEEWLIKKPWWNPFPVSRFTERPDVAAEHLTEGHVLVMIDTSPNALIFPVSFFSFLQSVEEYHEGIVVGTYLKWVRFLGLIFSWIGPPLWLALLAAGVHFGDGWAVLTRPQVHQIPLFWQVAGLEFGVDLLRLALTFSPDPLTQAMGFFGAILLGDIAVKAGLIDAEAMVYVTVAAVGTFAAPDIDFGMAVRVMRLVLLGFTGLGIAAHAVWAGFAAGLLLPFIMLVRTTSFEIPYLWPLLPLHLSELAAALVRKPLNWKYMRPSLTLPQDRTHRWPGPRE
ncbi:MAG: spore germination protein [Firmicutes bacterium]|nr:spore germination protein [Alicyclobacillaceae bacterium]MCL6496709.1 spore germination protein [Bacillota bacterium]